MENLYDSSYKSATGTSVLSMVMRKVYGRMFLALVVTALTSLYVASSPAILSVVLGNRAVFFGLMIAELAVVFVVSGMLNKLSTTTATLLFYLYAVLNGVVFSSIFVVYDLGSIAYTFFITAGVFGAMSVYGMVTKNDMTKFGSYCIMGLFGLIIGCQYIRGKQYSRLDYQFVRRGFVYRIDGMGHPKDQECGLCDRSFPDREVGDDRRSVALSRLYQLVPLSASYFRRS